MLLHGLAEVDAAKLAGIADVAEEHHRVLKTKLQQKLARPWVLLRSDVEIIVVGHKAVIDNFIISGTGERLEQGADIAGAILALSAVW